MIAQEKRQLNLSLRVSETELNALDSLMESYGAETRSQALRRLIRQAGAGQCETAL